MAFVNLPPNLQDIFGGITDRIAKLETGPNQAMYTADSAQQSSAQGIAQAQAAYAVGIQAQAQATQALIQAQAAYALGSQSLIKSANTITNASNQITGINGNGITVYSGASSTAGARVVLNSAGLAGYNSAGTATFAINAADGSVSTTGAIFTNSTISGGSLNINGNAIINSSGFLTATGATINGTITSSAATITGGSLTVGPSFQVTTAGVLTASNANISGQITATSGSIAGFTIVSAGGFNYLYSGNLTLDSTGTITGGNASTIYYGYANIGGGTPTGDRLVVTGGSNFNGTITALDIKVGGTMTYSGVTTGAGTAMVVVSTGSRVAIVTSSERFKQNVQYITSDNWLDKVLAMKPITYKTDADYTIAGEPNETQIGFLAEDINDIGGGFEHAVILDPLGEPFSLSYERLTVFLTLAIKEIKAKIDKLEGK